MSSFAFVSEMATNESARLRRLARSSFGPGFDAIVSCPSISETTRGRGDERAYVGSPVEFQKLRQQHTRRAAPEQQYGTADFRCHSLNTMRCASGGLDEHSFEGWQIAYSRDVASGISAVFCEATRHCSQSALVS